MFRSLVALLIALGLTSVVEASLMGFLVSQQMGTSVTGRLVYECTYSVGGSQTTIVLENMCPPTMMLD
jgi:hypothetical protein